MKTSVYVLLLAFHINGCQAKQNTCSQDEPAFVWPLHLDTGITEIMSNTEEGFIGNVAYMPATTGDDKAISSAMKFTGAIDSFAAVRVPENDAFADDYTIQFYVNFDSVSSGTILRYESDDSDTADDIEKLQIFVADGAIVVEMDHYGSAKYPVNLRPAEWTHIMFERDLSKKEIKLYVNRIGQGERFVSNNLLEKPTKAPGSLFLGGNMNVTEHFAGKLACLQIIPCKSTTKLNYDRYCKGSSGTGINGADITRQQSTTRSVAASTMATTASSISSTGSPTEVLNPGTLTPKGITLTTESSTGQSRSSTYGGDCKGILDSPNLDFNVESSCTHFTVIYEDKALANPAQKIDTAHVPDIVACTRRCNKFNGCFAFAVIPDGDGYICCIGPDSPDLITQNGSVFYKRVFC